MPTVACRAGARGTKGTPCSGRANRAGGGSTDPGRGRCRSRVGPWLGSVRVIEPRVALHVIRLLHRRPRSPTPRCGLRRRSAFAASPELLAGRAGIRHDLRARTGRGPLGAAGQGRNASLGAAELEFSTSVLSERWAMSHTPIVAAKYTNIRSTTIDARHCREGVGGFQPRTRSLDQRRWLDFIHNFIEKRCVHGRT